MNHPMFAFVAPHILPDAIRNIVVARAVAGTYDPHETDAKAIDGARAAARRSLRLHHLSHRQAVEVDALVLEARIQGRVMTSAELLQQRAILQQAQQAPVQASADLTPILRAIVRIEQLLTAIVALVFRRSGCDALFGAMDQQAQLGQQQLPMLTPSTSSSSALVRRGDVS